MLLHVLTTYLSPKYKSMLSTHIFNLTKFIIEILIFLCFKGMTFEHLFWDIWMYIVH